MLAKLHLKTDASRASHGSHPGTSLTEVIIAMFVMALGMVSLLTLFPLGAIQMGHAMRDNRTAQCATQADGVMRIWWQTLVVDPGLANPPTARDGFFALLDNPGAGYTAVATTDSGPSYPVVLDPIGHQARAGRAGQTRIAGDMTPLPLAVPRATLTPSSSFSQAFAMCSMKDDLHYNDQGVPDNSATRLFRGARYNWMAVIQRPNNNLRTTANFSVCVFEDRIPGSIQTNAEQVFTTNITPDATSVNITVNVNNPPKLSPRGWIMDGTIAAAAGVTPAIRNANFYRVQNITVQGGNWKIDLDTPIKRPIGHTATTVYNGNAFYSGQIYTFDNLFEVFERPQLFGPDHQAQKP